MKKIADSKLSIRKSGSKKPDGKEYGSHWIYIPSKLVKDSAFPFNANEPLKIEISDGNLIIRKKEVFIDNILDYGVENATLPILLENKAKENNKKLLLLFEEESYTYKEVNIRSNRIAHGILKLLKTINSKKCQIAVMLPNSPNYIFCWFGILKAGCTFVPINLYNKGEILKYIIDHSESKILIIDYKFLQEFKKISKDLTKLQKIIVLNAPKIYDFNGTYIPFQDIYSENEANPESRIKYYHNMEIFYPSKFTGQPKGIVIKHFMMLAGLIAANVMKDIEPQKSGIFYAPLPLYHAEVRYLVIFSALFLNLSIVLVEEFDPSNFWDEIKKYNATCFYFLGVLIPLLINQPPTEKDRDHPLKWAFGPEIPIDSWEIFENRFNVKLFNIWSRDECIPITFNKVGSKGGKTGSIGTPLDLFNIKIIDKNGKTLPPGSENVGEIVAKLDLPIYLNYYKPRENDEFKLLKGGWSYTGDLGYMDNEGYIYFAGQREDLIRKGNELINLHEIERIANRHPFIFESSAIDIPNEETGTCEFKICIVLRKDGLIDHESIYNYLRENLAFFMVPRYIEFKKQIREDITEYVNKFILRQEWNNKKARYEIWDAKLKDFIKI